MTIRFIEGFENSDSSTHYARKWAQFSAGTTNIAGRLQGDAAAPSGSTASIWRTRSLGLQNTWVVGMGFQYTEATVTDLSDAYPLVVKRGTAEQIRFQWRKGSGNTFRIDVLRGGSLLGSTSDFVPLSWHYFEFKFTINTGVGGAVQIRHNTQNDLTLSGINTADTGLAGADVFEISQDTTFNVARYDDMYILDDQGTENTDYRGDCVIEGRVPTGDGTPLDWSITNAFPHWQTLDADTAGNEYIYSDVIGDQDLLTFNALAFITGQIHGVQMTTTARLDTTGSRVFKHIIRSGGTLYTSPTGGVSHTVASPNYQAFYDVFELDPDTAVKWTNAGVDGASFGVEVVS